jgi:hypothetical protein
LIHTVVEVSIVVDVYAYELFARGISRFIFVSVECCYKEIPFGDEVFGSKPSEVITVCDNYDRFTFNPLVEKLGIPRCVVIVTLAETLIKFLREDLTGRRKTL